MLKCVCMCVCKHAHAHILIHLPPRFCDIRIVRVFEASHCATAFFFSFSFSAFRASVLPCIPYSIQSSTFGFFSALRNRSDRLRSPGAFHAFVFVLCWLTVSSHVCSFLVCIRVCAEASRLLAFALLCRGSSLANRSKSALLTRLVVCAFLRPALHGLQCHAFVVKSDAICIYCALCLCAILQSRSRCEV